MPLRSFYSPPFRTAMEPISGVILAGGRSRRFGKNKALELLKGKPLIEHVIERMKRLFPRILLSTNSPKEYEYLNLETVRDIIKGLGPIGGIYSCLSVIQDPYAFIAACDMPFLKADLIRGMLARRFGFDVVVPRVKGKVEPLHGCYSRRCLGEMKKNIQKKEFQIIRFYEKIRVYYMEEEEIRKFDPDLSSLRNINTLKDLKDCMSLE